MHIKNCEQDRLKMWEWGNKYANYVIVNEVNRNIFITVINMLQRDITNRLEHSLDQITRTVGLVTF